MGTDMNLKTYVNHVNEKKKANGEFGNKVDNFSQLQSK